MEMLCDRSVAKTGAVSVRNFRTIKVIGKGSYGKVLLVEKKDTKKMYALKILKKGEILRRNQLEHTLDERRILVSVLSNNQSERRLEKFDRIILLPLVFICAQSAKEG